jgi:hypothetical protein
MPLWGTGYPGSNPVSALNFIDLRPGDDLALFDGTEIVATGSKSIAFARGGSGSQMDAGSTFSVTGCPNGSVVVIQGSNGVSQSTTGALTVTPTLANMNASFVTVGTITGNGSYLDQGRYSFYRAGILTFVSGDVPGVIVKR